MTTDTPREIGSYLILERIGSGGMGIVYRAQDRRTNQIVALKVMREDVAQDESFVRRFQREAQIAYQLDSPHIVRVLEAGSEGNLHFIAQELVEGETLADLLKRRSPLAADEAADIALQVARGLAAAHQQGIIHRDISPQNIMLARDGTVKIADFGIARAVSNPTMTATGLFMGKPTYAAPETIEGMADIRSDIYALGVVLFEMLSGQVPFKGPTPFSTMDMHARVPPPRLIDLGTRVTAYLDGILRRCLQKDPRKRFQTPDELVTGLEAAAVPSSRTDEEPSSAAPRRTSISLQEIPWQLLLAGLGGLGVLVIFVVLAFVLAGGGNTDALLVSPTARSTVAPPVATFTPRPTLVAAFTPVPGIAALPLPSTSPEREVIEVLNRSNAISARALETLDDSLLRTTYTGDALSVSIVRIANLRRDGLYWLDELIEIQPLSITSTDANHVSVRTMERWLQSQRRLSDDQEVLCAEVTYENLYQFVKIGDRWFISGVLPEGGGPTC